MKKLKTILTKEETKFVKDEKRAIVKSYRWKIRRTPPNVLPPEGYKSWISWRLLEMIETIDKRSVSEFNMFFVPTHK